MSSRAASAAYRAANLEQVRAKDRIRSRTRYAQDPQARHDMNTRSRSKARQRCIDAYGGKCACCGENHIEFLAIDHVNGGGCRVRRETGRSGSEICRWLEKQGYPKDEYRLLCHNCNQARGWYGECPHERERS